MKRVRIAHIADVHLGAQLKGKSRLQEEIENNLIKGTIEIFKVINNMKVDVLLIAGDFYESSSVDFDLLNQVKEIFAGFSGRIVLAAGNHDYMSVESFYHGVWPQNTYIFKDDKIEYFEFKDLNLRVYGSSFTKSHSFERKLRDIGKIDDDFINIGVFHGQIDARENQYSPIYLEDIENSGLDYLALGHIHLRSEIKKRGKTYFAYSGNPVSRGFDETGEKGIYLGEISKEYNNLKFLKISNVQFADINVEIKDFSSQKEIANQIREKLKESFSENYNNNFYKIRLTGKKEKFESINIEMLKAELSEIKYIDIFDETKFRIDYERFKFEESLFGRFVKKVIENEEDFEEILELGYRAFEDKL